MLHALQLFGDVQFGHRLAVDPKAIRLVDHAEEVIGPRRADSETVLDLLSKVRQPQRTTGQGVLHFRYPRQGRGKHRMVHSKVFLEKSIQQ